MNTPSYWRSHLWIFPLLFFIISVISYLLFDLSFLKITFYGILGIPTPGRCLILEEKNCKMVKFITNPNRSESLLAVYKIPAGNLIFSPSDGLYSNSPLFSLKNKSDQYSKYPGITITSRERETTKVDEKIYSFIFYFQKLNSSKDAIKKGAIIGTTSDKNIDLLGDYNLVFAITKKTYTIPGKIKFESDDNALKDILTDK